MITDPQPYPGDQPPAPPGAVQVSRFYYDAVGRPLTGKLTVTGDGVAPASVELHRGTLNAALRPGTYRITGRLLTAENVPASISETVEVTG